MSENAERLEKFSNFYKEYKELSFLDFEELISKAKDEKEKLFYNMLLQYTMSNNFDEMLKNKEI